MKKATRLIITLVLVMIVVSALAVAAFAATSTPKNGWYTDENGIERYYENGEYVTGTKKIGEFTYSFSDDGAFIRMVDAHKNIGTCGTMDTAVYKSAVSALGSKLHLGITFNNGENKVAYNNSLPYTDIVAGEGNAIASGEKSNIVASSSATTLSVERVNVHLKTSKFEFVDRGNGNTAVQNWQSSISADPFININPAKVSAGIDYVYEAEYKLGEDFETNKSNMVLLQVVDRKNADTGADVFRALLHLNKDGMVYSSEYSSAKFFCQLSEYEYTRISVSVHPSENTYDVYVNGVLVVGGLTFAPSNAAYTSANFEVNEFRTNYFGGLSENFGASLCLDNVYLYEASAPLCTEVAEPRNGACVEGGAYLRYYENNLLISGRRSVTGTFFGKTFDKTAVVFNSSGRYFVGNTATMIVGAQQYKAAEIYENVFIAPEAMDVDGKEFIGWKITDKNGNVDFALPGQRYRVSSNITYEPVAIKYDMMDGASVRTNADSTGLRFMAQIAKSDYDVLSALGLTVNTHMVIVPTEYIEKTYGYTTIEAFKALEADGYAERVDIASKAWYYSTENYYYYVGSVANILAENFAIDYSGIAYLEITDRFGKTFNVYADYNEEVNSRSVYEVASKAYNDRISGSKGTYLYKVAYKGNNTYSPYNAGRLAVIKGFADKVIMLDVDESGVRSYGDYYDAPYALTVNKTSGEYSISIKNSGDWNVDDVAGLVLNGKLLSADGYVKGNGEYSLTVDLGETVISNDGVSTEFDSWYLADVENSTDVAMFNGGKVKFPETAPNGETNGFKWKFGSNGTPVNIGLFSGNSKSLGWNMDEDGNSTDRRYTPTYNSTAGTYVLDMSDWTTLEFYYYAPKEYIGTQFMLLFKSENPAVSGSDYYSETYTVTKAGWNKVVASRIDMPSSRSPLGWDKITSFVLNNSGWGMGSANESGPNTDLGYEQYLYFTSMVFTNNTEVRPSLEAIEELSNAAAFYPGGYAGVINSQLYTINPDNTNAVTFKDGDTYYLPLSVFARGLADNANIYGTGNVVVMEMGGSTYRFSEGKTYVKDGKAVKLKSAAKGSEGALFISAEDAMAIFGYTQKYIDRMGLIVLSNTENIFDEVEDYDKIYAIIEECIYVRPTGEKMYEDIMAHSGGVHPYLMIDQKGFDSLKYYSQTDATLAGYINKYKQSYGVESKGYKAEPAVYDIYDGTRLSRTAMQNLRGFVLAYKLYEFDDPENAVLLAERVWKELESIISFPDWNPSHYLDTAEYAFAVALAYDWMYDYWVEYDAANGTNRLGQIAETLYNYSLKTTSALGGVYNLGSPSNNWNGVCNGGTMAAALALVTDPTYRDDAIKVLSSSIKGVENGMWVYGPDGGYEEGPGYWSYGSTYLAIFLSSVEAACGTDYGIYHAPGFAHSVYFPTYLASMNTTWGFHDGGSGTSDTSASAWFALKSGDGNVNAIRRQAIENGWKGSSFYDIIWFSPHVVNNSITLDLDAYYSLDTIMTFRDSWDERNSIFTGLHGGDNSASHGDLDIGNFVICVDGTYMICDLGSDNYNVAAYFGIYRWSYYRKRAEGQNTLVMLPHGESWAGKTGIPYSDPVTNAAGATNGPECDQKLSAVSKCLRYETGKNSALGVVDMKPAFSSYIASNKTAIRGLWFKDNRSTIVIQDEGTYAQAMDIWWFAHTQGNITVSDDGKSALIERNGVYLYAELVTNIAGATFYASAAESLDPNYVGDTADSEYHTSDTEQSREGYRKLCVKAENVTEYKLAVVFKVIAGPDSVPEFGTTYTWTDIKDWKVD